MTNELRRLLSQAIVEWAADERDARGDIFATARDLENIKSDPLAFADLLKGEDAYKFLDRLLGIERREQERVDAFEQAERWRKQTFETSDGYRLRYDAGLWTDGDLEFIDRDGWPVDAEGEELRGSFREEGR